ncbi:MAG TPA: D-glycerate dehydrogenase [Bacillota bacterium]|nr:D-glycerate dehydrogenase [Bacillota bacterium]
MTKPLVYITRKIPEHLLTKYEEHFHVKMWESEDTPVPRDIFLQEVAEADGLLCMLSDSIDEELMEQGKHVKVISNLAVGYNNIDVESASKKSIVVTNTPDVLTETTADLTFALLMATARRIVEASDYVKEDEWQDWSPFLLAGADIHHQTIGIVGMGRIGEAVARRARGFGMEVLYHNRSRKESAEKELQAQYVSFDELLERSDFIVPLAPLTEETNEMFDHEAFDKMKETAMFINASRGQVVNEDALYEALTTGKIAAAGLDVFTVEPIRSDNRFVQLNNTVCLPHIGSSSVKTRTAMVHLCCENIAKVLNGKQAKTPVN